jgi:rapamycin-insensitive companion of mTOR
MKLVRRMLKTLEECVDVQIEREQLLPRAIASSVVALAEQQNDALSKVSMVVLCEMAVLAPRVVSEAGGVKALCNLCVQMAPPNEHAQRALVTSLLYLLNTEESRRYVSDLDVRLAIQPLTRTYGEVKAKPERATIVQQLEASKRVLVAMLRTWPGLMALWSNEQGLRAVVDTLRMQPAEYCSILIDGFFAVLRIVQPKAGDDPFVHRRHGIDEGSSSSSSSGGADMVENRMHLPPRLARHNLMENYLAALLLALVDCNVIEALVHFVIIKSDADAASLVAQHSGGAADDAASASALLARKVAQRNASIKATILLGEVLHMSNALLPPAQCARLQSLARLVQQAASFGVDPRLRSRASSMISNLHQYMHMKETEVSSTFDFHAALLVSGANKWRRLKGKDRRLDRIEEVKLKLDWRMDESTLRAKMAATNVLATNDWEQWHWDIVSDLLEGPLTNPSLVATALRTTKFMRRLVSFLRPSSNAFALMSRTPANLKYVRIACQVIEVLLTCDVGRDFLEANKLLSQIANMLTLETNRDDGCGGGASDSSSSQSQAISGGGSSSPSADGDHDSSSSSDAARDRLFSAERVLRSMAREYFTMLGTLSSSSAGIKLLNKYKVFEYLMPLSVMPGREDLSHLIMTSLDYNMPGPSRILLQYSLTTTSKVIRFLATRHLRVLLRAGVSGFPNWGVKFLVKQLADSDRNVVGIALSVLDEACDDTECLESLIGRRPNLQDMGQPGKDLLLRFLTRPSGFQALDGTGFIRAELDAWHGGGCVQYALQMETSLREAFAKAIQHRQPARASSSDASPADTVNLPPHLYGELASTRPGCALLAETKHVDEFAGTAFGESRDAAVRCGALWALGHIGRSASGLQAFLAADGLVPRIIAVAERSADLSLRGTAFYALGLIAATEQGRELLGRHQWHTPKNHRALIALPADVGRSGFLRVDSVGDDIGESDSPQRQPAAVGSQLSGGGSAPAAAADSGDSAVELIVGSVPNDCVPAPYKPAPFAGVAEPSSDQELMRLIVNLSNHILSESSVRQLKRIYQENAERFLNPSLYAIVLKLLQLYHFRLPFRRFIYGLFRKTMID